MGPLIAGLIVGIYLAIKVFTKNRKKQKTLSEWVGEDFGD